MTPVTQQTATSEARRPRVALCPLGGPAPGEVTELLARRGVASQIATLADAGRAEVGAIAAVVRSPISAEQCAELAPLCRAAAARDRPVILLAPPPMFKSATEAAQISAHLEAAGAVVWSDPDPWLETAVLIAAFGIPRGPRVALVLPAGSWLEAAADALAAERFADRVRAQALASERASELEPTDVVLCDVRELPPRLDRSGALVVPLRARGELVGEAGAPVLVGLRAALAAAAAAGRLRQRLEELAAPAPPAAELDRARIDRQLARLGERAGDHETKVLLAAAGVAITRQAVATTASAATRLAKRAGFPVEMKPWGPDVPDELSGCPLERDLATAADVRRAFGQLAAETGAAIVREAPPPGRELSVAITWHKALGWTATVRISGERAPLAAPCPLHRFDAERLAAAAHATRLGDPDPDHAALADLLRRASELATGTEAIAALHMPRVVAGEREVVVVDARAELKKRG